MYLLLVPEDPEMDNQEELEEIDNQVEADQDQDQEMMDNQEEVVQDQDPEMENQDLLKKQKKEELK